MIIPVPVGDSSNAFSFDFNAAITLAITAICGWYGFRPIGKYRSIPLILYIEVDDDDNDVVAVAIVVVIVDDADIDDEVESCNII